MTAAPPAGPDDHPDRSTGNPVQATGEQMSPAEPPSGAAPATRPADPERGLRGAMSATLVLEALTILLSLPVAAKTSGGVGPVGVGVILVLALLHIAACVVVRRPWALTAILALQVGVIACWFISTSLGVMGVIFGAVWAVIAWFRYEYRRRFAAGTLPSQQRPSG